MIRSAFILILISFAAALAQPQAPIEWTEVRWLPTPELEEYDYTKGIWSHGDTLVAAACYRIMPENDIFPKVSFSIDNGNSFGPWHVLYDADSIGVWSADCQIAFVSDGVLCRAFDPRLPHSLRYGLWRTTDLGQTWEWPPYTGYHLPIYDQRSDSLYCTISPDSVTWTCDDGNTFAALRSAGFTPQPILDLAASRQHIHAMTWDAPNDTARQRVRYARASLLSGGFEPAEIINPNIGWTDHAAIEFGEDGIGMILSCDEYQPPAPDHGAIILNITRDDGATWSPADTLTPGETAAYDWLDIWHHGHWWLACWIDTELDSGFDRWGLRCAFSPNNGQYWYPSHQIEGSGDYQVYGISGEFGPSWVRISMAAWHWIVRPAGYYFSQFEGLIHPDTLLPTLTVVSIPSDTVHVSQSLAFVTQATDNDTVYEVRTEIRDHLDSSWTVVMNRAQLDTFRAAWSVPWDGRFHYRIVAEDRWENLSSYPDSGWSGFVTEGWIDAADNVIILPSAFSVSVFPNPSNGCPRIKLSSEWFGHGPVTITVYNLLGQELIRKDVVLPAGSSVRIDQLAGMGSGVYLLHVTNHRATRALKFVLLK